MNTAIITALSVIVLGLAVALAFTLRAIGKMLKILDEADK